MSCSTGISLKELCSVLESIAPTYLADTWDNTGLLIQPTKLYDGSANVQNILLTNDLTESVMREAIEKHVQFIWSYHPPLFTAFKRLRQSNWKERLAMLCLENGIAVYSPHTALDAVVGGVNDWLISPYDKSEVRVLQVPSHLPPKWFILNLLQTHDQCLRMLKAALAEEPAIRLSKDATYVIVPASKLDYLKSALRATFGVDDLYEIHPLPSISEDSGYGRWAKLSRPYSIQDVVHATKKLLEVDHIMLAFAVGHEMCTPVEELSVCAGSGGSLLLKKGQGAGMKPQIYITGEMSHHEVLDCVHSGVSVILTRHSTSERGYLVSMMEKLVLAIKENNSIASPNVFISKADQEPLQII